MINVSSLQLQKVILEDMSRVNMKELTYPCNKCEYAATQTGDLKRHTKRKHKPQFYYEIKCNTLVIF